MLRSWWKTCPGRFTSHERSGHSREGRKIVNSPALEAIVKHEGRLDVLCCILDGGPLAVPQLSARTGDSPQAVGHNVQLLESFGLVEKIADLDGSEPLYVATLDKHPRWVWQAVEKHRRH
jgi:hypothetical protein